MNTCSLMFPTLLLTVVAAVSCGKKTEDKREVPQIAPQTEQQTTKPAEQTKPEVKTEAPEAPATEHGTESSAPANAGESKADAGSAADEDAVPNLFAKPAPRWHLVGKSSTGKNVDAIVDYFYVSSTTISMRGQTYKLPKKGDWTTSSELVEFEYTHNPDLLNVATFTLFFKVNQKTGYCSMGYTYVNPTPFFGSQESILLKGNCQ